MGATHGRSRSSGEEAERAQNKRVRESQERAFLDDRSRVKLLLLGAGESGKSTLFKQMKTLFGTGADETELRMFAATFRSSIISEMQALCRASVQFCDKEPECLPSEENFDATDRILRMKPEDPFTEDVAADIDCLWHDQGIRATYQRRFRFQLADSAVYLFNRAHAAAGRGFLPNHEDYLRCRVRTTGVSDAKFVVEDRHFQVLDVGGQKNERKKWLHQFENVSAILWVVGLSDYDLDLYEDGETNRMHDAIQLFEETVNNRWFINCPVVLFLNKLDLFQEKLQYQPLRICFPDYEPHPEDDPVESAISFIYKEFKCRVKTRQNPNRKSAKKRLWKHVTTATNQQIVSDVFLATKEIVLYQSLALGGLQ